MGGQRPAMLGSTIQKWVPCFFLRWCQHYAKDEGHYVCERRIATQQSEGTTLLKGSNSMNIVSQKSGESSFLVVFLGYPGIPLEITVSCFLLRSKTSLPYYGQQRVGISRPPSLCSRRILWLNGTLLTPNRGPPPTKTALFCWYSCVNYWLNPQIWVWGYMLGLRPNFYDRWTCHNNFGRATLRILRPLLLWAWGEELDKYRCIWCIARKQMRECFVMANSSKTPLCPPKWRMAGV